MKNPIYVIYLLWITIIFLELIKFFKTYFQLIIRIQPLYNIQIYLINQLHLASSVENNRSINVILSFLSQLEFTRFKTFREICPKMVNFSKFIDYISE